MPPLAENSPFPPELRKAVHESSGTAQDGQVRRMVDKFVALSGLTQKMGMGTMRVMTDFSAERYWTVVAEMEVPAAWRSSPRCRATRWRNPSSRPR